MLGQRLQSLMAKKQRVWDQAFLWWLEGLVVKTLAVLLFVCSRWLN